MFYPSGWELGLRSTNGSGQSIYDLWSGSASLNADNCSLRTLDADVTGVVKDDVINSQWHNVVQVKLFYGFQ